MEAQKKSSNEAAVTTKVVSDAKSALELTEYMRLTTLKHKYKEDFAKSPLDFFKIAVVFGSCRGSSGFISSHHQRKPAL